VTSPAWDLLTMISSTSIGDDGGFPVRITANASPDHFEVEAGQWAVRFGKSRPSG
jgi:hypothetical protein